MIGFSLGGSTKRTTTFLTRMRSKELYTGLESLAEKGVASLRENTPTDTGLTSDSWGYEIELDVDKSKITWTNSNRNNDVNIAIILQYGHGTGSGGYVSGRDYINPAMKPVFDEIAEAVWRKVTSA